VINFLRADKTWERKKKEMTSDEEETSYQSEGGRPCRICGASRGYKREYGAE
jgi:ribosomal protein S14